MPGIVRQEFAYDGVSRMRVSRVYAWNATTGAWGGLAEPSKVRVYDGLDVVQERDKDNVVTATVTRSGNIGAILARTTAGSGTSYYGYDLQGNVTSLSDSTGAMVGSYAYDAWGNTLAATGARAAENPYRFSTKEQIGGLYHFGFRFYNSGTGRWLNRDPIGEDGGVNLYAGIANNPVNFADDYGATTRPCSEILKDINRHLNGDPGMKGFLQRGRDLLGDIGEQYKYGDEPNVRNGQSTRWNTHLRAYHTRRDSVQQYLDEWDKSGCGGKKRKDNNPPTVNRAREALAEEARNPITQPSNPRGRYFPPKQRQPNPSNAVAVGAGLGVGYLIYRGIRLLPSALFPPSLVPNLAIP